MFLYLRLSVFAITFLLTGCSVSFIDKDGFEHTYGIFHSSVKVSDNTIFIEKTTIGLNLGLATSDEGLTLGFKNSQRVFLKNDMIVSINKDDNTTDVTVESYKIPSK